MKHECVQHMGKNTMDKVNCTETVSFLSSSGQSGVVQTKTVSVLIMLRTLDSIPLSFGKSAVTVCDYSMYNKMYYKQCFFLL